jgi:chromosome segregation ATPase
MRRGLLVGTALGLLLGCAGPKPPPLQAAPARPDPDASFALGRFSAAIAEYEELERTANDPDAALRSRFLAAMARLALDDLAEGSEAQKTLRRIEREHPASLWGAVSRVYLAELARGVVLHQAVLRSGVELHENKERIAAYEATLSSAETDFRELQAAFTVAREERAKFQTQLKEAQVSIASLEERIRELESELAALKQIDMKRQP